MVVAVNGITDSDATLIGTTNTEETAAITIIAVDIECE